jgi:hypothetical protein
MDAITILYSAEVRWFVKGTLPGHVLEWFLQGAGDHPESRTDRYLLFLG